MDFLELAKARYSVRSFDKTPVPPEITEKIVEAGLAAPTAHNYQPQKIIVVSSEDGPARFRKCTPCHFNAPLAFIVSYDKNICWNREIDGKSSGDIDASIAATQMMLEAADLGIGSTWIMYFDPDAVKTEFAFPDNLEPVALFAMGYPAADAEPSPKHFSRKDPAEIVSYV